MLYSLRDISRKLSTFLYLWFCMYVFILAISCGIPKAPTNGGILTTDYLVGTRVTYFCHDGYRLSSKELTTAVCQSDGTWSNHNKTPRCVGMFLMKISSLVFILASYMIWNFMCCLNFRTNSWKETWCLRGK